MTQMTVLTISFFKDGHVLTGTFVRVSDLQMSEFLKPFCKENAPFTYHIKKLLRLFNFSDN